MKSPESTIPPTTPNASPRRARGPRRIASAAAAATLLAASASGAAVTLRTASTFAADGDVLICQAVNWDSKPRKIDVRIVLVNDGSEAESASCDPTSPLTACNAIENVSVPILSAGFFACEVEADGPKPKFRAVLQNVTKGDSIEAR